MPVDRNRGIPTPTVAHEGNPRSDSLVVSGTLDGEAFIHFAPIPLVTGTPPPDAEPPPPPSGDCPDCVSFVGSVAADNAATEALCASDTGDGCVVTCPGDYSFDPTFYDQACANYYGDFRFGLNASRFDDVDAPSWYTTSPSLWLPPKGTVLVNSSCAGRISRYLQFDYTASSFGSTVNYEAVTPATFQSQVIDDWNATGAHGQRSVATPDGTPNSGVTVGGFMDCRFLFLSSASSYYTACRGYYMSENNNPVSGVAMLTDDGSNTTITGYGVIVNSFSGTLEAVQWSGAPSNGYTVLASIPWVARQNDFFEIRIVQECPCPYGSTDASSIHPAYPKGGEVWAIYQRQGDPSATTLYKGSVPSYPSSIAGSLGPAEFQSLGYGAMVVVPVSNGRCDNQAVWRGLTTFFFSTITSC